MTILRSITNFRSQPEFMNTMSAKNTDNGRHAIDIKKSCHTKKHSGIDSGQLQYSDGHFKDYQSVTTSAAYNREAVRALSPKQRELELVKGQLNFQHPSMANQIVFNSQIDEEDHEANARSDQALQSYKTSMLITEANLAPQQEGPQ